MKTIIWTCIYTHIIITTYRQPSFSVFSSGDTNLMSRDVGNAQRLRLTGTEELRNNKVKLTSTKEMTSTEMLTNLKHLNSTSTEELTSIKELTSKSTKESTSMISTRKSRMMVTEQDFSDRHLAQHPLCSRHPYLPVPLL